jgi:hypothetical protein
MFDHDEYPEVRVEHDVDDPDVVFENDFGRRAAEIQPTPSASSGFPIIPAKKGPWSGNNNLGIERVFAPDANNQQTILKMPEWDFPAIWTLCLGLNDFSEEGASPIIFDIVAKIDFGIGGVMQTVEIDWLNGVCISLPMNAVNVIARFDTGYGEGGSVAPDDLRLRACLAKGNFSGAPPLRTIKFDNSNFVPIPPFARRVFLSCQGSQASGQDPFTFYSNGQLVGFHPNNTNSSIVAQTYQTSQFVSYIDVVNQLVGGPMWLPVPPLARFLLYLTPTGSDQTLSNVYAHFEIGV